MAGARGAAILEMGHGATRLHHESPVGLAAELRAELRSEKERAMTTLLSEILEAHGGLERWKQYQKVEATIVSGGGLFALKGVPQDPSPRRMTVWLHEERSSVFPYGAADQRTMFTPERVAIAFLSTHRSRSDSDASARACRAREADRPVSDEGRSGHCHAGLSLMDTLNIETAGLDGFDWGARTTDIMAAL
jgi:hypothetical protein